MAGFPFLVSAGRGGPIHFWLWRTGSRSLERELRILFLEDSPSDAALLQRELRSGGLSMAARVVETREAFVRELDGFQPDLVIADYSLPAFDGLEALDIVRARSPWLPFILATGHIGEERAAEALKRGATDILLKDRLSRLSPGVERALREVEERAERERLEAMLRQAQKMEAVGQLAGGLAHDFNNMLTIIIGYLQVLGADVAADPVAEEHVQLALKASRRAADLIRRLLMFSQRNPLEPKAFDLNDAVATASALLRSSLGETIQTDLELGDDLWPVFADPALFASALTNLAINARDAMPSGGRLTIRTANMRQRAGGAAAKLDLAPGDYVIVTVSDTGEGIAPDLLERVLEPFFTTKEVGKGTGLGLSMVYGFASQSGGQIQIESTPGAGASVTIYLPRARLDVAPPHADCRVAPAPSGVGVTILVVEDDPDVRRLVAIQLRALGYRVLEALDGPDAMTHLRQDGAVDLLFTDVVMPGGLTGPELVDQARRVRPDLKAVFTSGFAEGALRGRPDITEPLLSKPYMADELARTIREALAG